MPKIQKKTKSSNVLKFSFTETLNSGLRTFRCNVNVRYIGCFSLAPGSSETQQGNNNNDNNNNINNDDDDDDNNNKLHLYSVYIIN